MPMIPGTVGNTGFTAQRRALQAARLAAEDERGLLEGALTTLGRPGFVIRNLLAGDFEGAGQQASVLLNQIASAAPTAGLSLVDPNISIMGALAKITGDDSWDPDKYAPRKTEREFSDMLDELGMGSFDRSDSPWARFAVDLVGGIVTDPFSLVGGAAGGVGKGAKGLMSASSVVGRGGTVASRTRRAMDVTRGGRKLLSEGADPMDVLSGALRRRTGVGMGPMQDLSLFANREQLVEATKQLVGEGVLAPHALSLGLTRKLGRSFGVGKLSGGAVPVTRLGKAAALAKQSAMPAIDTLVNPLNRHFLMASAGGAMGGIPGAAAGAMIAKLPIVDDLITRMSGEFTRTLIDRFTDKAVPHGIQEGARGVFQHMKSRTAEITRQAAALFFPQAESGLRGVSLKEQEALTDVLSSLSDDLIGQRVVSDKAEAWLKQHLPGTNIDRDRWIDAYEKAVSSGRMTQVPQHVQDTMRKLHWQMTDARMPTESAINQTLLARAASHADLQDLPADRVKEIYDWYLGTMRELRKELVDKDIWSDLPRRLHAGDDIVLHKQFGKKGPRRHRQVTDYDPEQWRVREVFGDGRARIYQPGVKGSGKIVDLKATTRDAKNKLRPHDYRIVNAQEQSRVEDLFYARRDFQPWVEDELGDAAKRSPTSFTKTRGKTTRSLSTPDFEKHVEKLLLREAAKGGADNLKRVQDLIATRGARHGLTVSSLPVLALGRARGQHHMIAKTELGKLAKYAPEFKGYLDSLKPDLTAALKGSGKALEAYTAINRRWKGLLTGVNPAFHARNFLSTFWGALQDPDIGVTTALKAWLTTGMDSLPSLIRSVVARTTGKVIPLGHGKLRTAIDAAYGNKAAWKRMGSQRFGPNGNVNGQDLLKFANGNVLRQSQAQREVIQDLMGVKVAKELGQVGKATGGDGKLLGSLDKLNDMGGDVANFIEDRMRFSMFAELVNSGHTMQSAAFKTNRAMVDYEIQSVRDYWVRQLFPFIRFTMGTMGPSLRAVRDRPLYRGVVRQAQVAARDDTGAPQDARRGFSIPSPLGGGYLRGIGVPLEATADVLRAIPSTQGDAVTGQRRMLANIQPGLQAALGSATDTDLYWGGDFWRGRTVKGPEAALLRDTGLTSYNRETKQEYLKPGANRFLGTIPFARQVTSAREAMRSSSDVESTARFAVKFLTGLSERPAEAREAQSLIEDYLLRRKQAGDVGVYRRFFGNPVGDPQLKAILEAYEALKNQQRKGKKK